MESNRYELQVLQKGGLPLQPDGCIRSSIDHLCTSVLVWPESTIPVSGNSLIVDPCFNERSLRTADKRMQKLGTTFDKIGHVFVTHNHRDHLPNSLVEQSMGHWVPFTCRESGPLQDLRFHPCPGHSADLRALILNTKYGQCWIVGDAIINGEWLLRWGYYWPNGYTAEQIVQTWRSVGAVLSAADLVVPGHGKIFRVTTRVVEEVLSNWPMADFNSMCQDVEESLRYRLEDLKTMASGRKFNSHAVTFGGHSRHAVCDVRRSAIMSRCFAAF